MNEGLSTGSWSGTTGLSLCLVLSTQGVSVCICPKYPVHGVSFSSKPQAGSAGEQGALHLGRGIRQGEGLCWYLDGHMRTQCLWDEHVSVHVFAVSTKLDRPVSGRPVGWVRGAQDQTG